MRSWINFLAKKIAGGILLGWATGIVLGVVIYVHAVESGTTRNPLFSPTLDDVRLTPECVTGRYDRNPPPGNPSTVLFPSSSGKTYTASNVVIGATVSGAGQITCKAGWFMTGCSSFCGGAPDPDEAMITQNTCQGTPSGGCSNDYTFIRCCKSL